MTELQQNILNFNEVEFGFTVIKMETIWNSN